MSKGFRADGKTGVDVHCQKCNRRWLHLRGTPAGGLDKFPSGRFRGIYFVSWMGESGVAPEEWHDPWKNATATVRPQVTVDQYAAEVVGVSESNGRPVQHYDRQRYRITCRRQCGRGPTVVTAERLEQVFVEAVATGRPDTAL